MRGLLTSDYDYTLPPGRIAQSPTQRRDDSRLMVVHKTSGEIEHRKFSHLPEYLHSGDALVLNTTKVFKARLLGERASGAPAEIFLLRKLGENEYEAMVSPGGKLKPGRTITIVGELSVEILETTERRTRRVRLISELPAADAIEKYGHVPLPPYIDRSDSSSDAERYQTVYANETGSVAAPTAGLHFTPELLQKIASNGVKRIDLVLHVGAGTFKPVEVDDPRDHVMHEEWYDLSAKAAQHLNTTKKNGGKIWAVGTTSVRTLETAAQPDASFHSQSGETAIFIRPPYRFRSVDAIVTNFHLPRSTLIMLVAAFAGYELTMHAYDVAIREGYRFYSYGDAMAITD